MITLSEFSQYLVTCGEGNDLQTYKVKGSQMATVFNLFDRVVQIEEIHTYEIYTCSETGVKGWDIEYVESTDRLIKTFPRFDCIITKNSNTIACDQIEHFENKLNPSYPYRGEFK